MIKIIILVKQYKKLRLEISKKDPALFNKEKSMIETDKLLFNK